MSDDGNITYQIRLCKPVIANGQSDHSCHGDTSVCMHYKNGTVMSGGNFSTESKSSQGTEKGELWLVMTGDPCLDPPETICPLCWVSNVDQHWYVSFKAPSCAIIFVSPAINSSKTLLKVLSNLLHSEQPKLYGVLAVLSAKGLKTVAPSV